MTLIWNFRMLPGNILPKAIINKIKTIPIPVTNIKDKLTESYYK